MQKQFKKLKLPTFFLLITLIIGISLLTFKTINITKAQTDTTPPTTPTNLTATTPTTGGSSQINLTWTASTDDTAVIGYNIYRCTGSSCTPTTSIGTSSTNSYSDTGLTAETTYTYAVSAYDGVPNTSSNSATVSGTTESSGIPVITSVSRNIVDGETITVGGGSFGVKENPQPLKYDSFEWGNIGDEIDTGNDPVSPKWQKTGAGGAQIDNTYVHSGEKSAFKEASTNSGDCSFYDSYINVASGKEMYVSYWFRWDYKLGTDIADNDFFKLNRINSGGVPYFGSPSYVISLVPDYNTQIATRIEGLNYINASDTSHNSFKNTVHKLEQNKWHRIEMYLKLSDPPGDTNGEIQLFLDGYPEDWVYAWGGDLGGVTKDSESLNFIDTFTLMFSGCRYAQDNYPLIWQDDIYVDSSRARVELGNAPTWSANTHREIQIPTSWSTNSIEITFNQGSFSNGDTAYLYVVDENGVMNETGYPITIGGTATDTTAPTLSNPSPSTTLPAGTTSTTLSITTNENSICKYSTTPNTTYASMTNTFSTTGSTSHSQTINNLTNGSTYNYYIRCSDTSNNVNTTDTTITFNISTPITYNLSNFTSLVANWLGIGDNNSDVNNDGIVNTRDIGIMMSNWE